MHRRAPHADRRHAGFPNDPELLELGVEVVHSQLAGVLRVQPQRRVEPAVHELRVSFRPLVEPGGGRPGDQPRPPHRTAISGDGEAILGQRRLAAVPAVDHSRRKIRRQLDQIERWESRPVLPILGSLWRDDIQRDLDADPQVPSLRDDVVGDHFIRPLKGPAVAKEESFAQRIESLVVDPVDHH